MATPQLSPQQDADKLIFLATSDLAARTKGRALRAADFKDDTTVGWVPANIGIGSLGHIVGGIPFGSSGDLRLKPDLASRTTISGVPGRPDLDIVFANLVETDGRPWGACPRTFLETVVQDLREEFGITLRATFEHEFVDMSAGTAHHPFSLQALRDLEPLGTELMALFDRAGLEPETWLPEYAKDQFEITVAPTTPLEAADRAVLVRDLVRDLFNAYGRQASFAPVVAPSSGGSGVHVHFGLDDLDGETLLFDPTRPGRLSELGGKFAAGIVRHAPAYTAMFAPLVTSYLRLAPNNWSTACAFLGLQNREALLRICPTNEIDGRDPKRQLHFEFRGSDIGANPWLLLGTVLRAGLQGLRDDLAAEDIVVGEVDLEGTHSHLLRLPESLAEALDRLESDEVVSNWYDSDLLAAFLAVKHDEIAKMSGLSEVDQIEAYTRVY